MRRFSDGIDRPDSYDGTSLSRGIEQYFADARMKEASRLRTENAAMRAAAAAEMLRNPINTGVSVSRETS